MKEVLAVIRMNKINETKRALIDAGLPAFTARKVLGRGKGLVDPGLLEGASEGRPEAIAQLGDRPRFWPKRALTFVVPDDKVEKMVEALIQVNRSGHPGDGKIFVLPINEAIRVRTGERDSAAIDDTSER